MANDKLKFPKRFLWGASTSAHQVEGDTHNQWSVWELENARALASAAPHKIGYLDDWDDIKAQATDPNNYVSGLAADHFNRYEQDFDLLERMNLNAFRFSIEWSRIEPKEGQFDSGAIQHYRDYIKDLKKRGIEPFVTLYHWTVPVWFDQKGGFERGKNIKYFVRFAEKIFDELGPELKYVTTINEPDTVMGMGYVTAEHPPQKRAPLLGAWVYLNLLRAHKRIYKLARGRSRRFKVGWTKNYAFVRPKQQDWKSRLAVRLDFWLRDDLQLWFIGKKTAFIGVNYYFSDLRDGTKLIDHGPDTARSDLGWEMLPDDLELVLKRVGGKRHKLPLIVTESGVADADDKYRKWWLAHSLKAIDNAIKAGIRVDGYLHWSLLDNFEWAYGFWPRFGLVAVDYPTQKRQLRPSAKWYGQVVKQMRETK
ncbi:MAG TPA: family 1 glycosylhydrolase [Candidatus Saccharimonadales bacterium]|nr:family 1 glycosylhydrolase [Candidatus Saccharimonadales bacterium]